jgi:hypothetical protein
MHDPARAFAARVLRAHRDDRHLDDFELQDVAEALGLLHRVEVTAPCGDDCQCEEYGDFPQDCLRLTDAGKALLAEFPEKTGDGDE